MSSNISPAYLVTYNSQRASVLDHLLLHQSTACSFDCTFLLHTLEQDCIFAMYLDYTGRVITEDQAGKDHKDLPRKKGVFIFIVATNHLIIMIKSPLRLFGFNLSFKTEQTQLSQSFLICQFIRFWIVIMVLLWALSSLSSPDDCSS